MSARVATLGLSVLLAGCAGSGAAPSAPPPAPARGSLFSAIPCAGTPLGRTWDRLLPEATARFPGLRLTKVEDLHVTVVYVGPGWRETDLGRLRALALVVPREPFASRPEIARFGATGHVVVAELKGAPPGWRSAVSAAKAALNALGLKRPDLYDAEFRPHVTLATARSRPPGAAEREALEELQAWLAAHAAADPASFEVPLGPESPLRLWLAGLDRPADAPTFVDVDGGR